MVPERIIKLVNGRNATEGIVEVYLQGQWGTVCGDTWDIKEATVVCSQLGYLDAISAELSTTFGESSELNGHFNINCLGNEATIANCSVRKASQQSNCENAGVRCNPKPCPSSMYAHYKYVISIV